VRNCPPRRGAHGRHGPQRYGGGRPEAEGQQHRDHAKGDGHLEAAAAEGQLAVGFQVLKRELQPNGLDYDNDNESR
jgi:hypothetical protein